MSNARALAAGRSNSISVFTGWSMIGWILCLILLTTNQWLLGPSLFVLLLGIHFLSRDDGPPVVVAAFSYQWLQVTIALGYAELTGRQIVEMRTSHYEPMVLIGLAAVSSFFGGYWLITRKSGGKGRAESLAQPPASIGPAAVTYASAIVISLLIQRIAVTFPTLTQLLVMLGFARYALLYLLVTRLARPRPRWGLIALVICVELAIGFSGYFASFRESLLFIGIAIIVSIRHRRATTWIVGAGVGVIAFYAAVTWTAIKPMVRREFSYNESTSERLARVAGALGPALSNPATEWTAQVDPLISRMWQVYYPALMLQRVPSVVPHTNGSILRGAVTNTLMPRIFFPGKGVLPSESDKVRKYAGIHVAGRETGTSFAFGYTAESYVDFGWPLMLVPIFAFGCLIGFADRAMRFLIASDDVFHGMRSVFLWSSMYMFETSWVMLIGTTASLFVVLLAAGVVFDRLLDKSGGEKRRLRMNIPRARPRDPASGQSPIHSGGQIRAG